MEPRTFAGPITSHEPALMFGNFVSDTGTVAEGLGISYDCFDSPPPVGELVIVRVWTEQGQLGEIFRQSARLVTEEEKSELEALPEAELGEWLRSRTVR